MPFVALRTKLTVPRLRVNIVSRPRLTNHLTEGLARPVTIITAPAGFGKTTLFGEWCTGRGAGMPVAWVSLEPSDSAPLRFWSYVVTALRGIPALGARADFGASTMAALDRAPQPAVDQFLAPLLNDIAVSGAPFVLVLDDYHLAAGAEIDEAMRLVLDQLPENMRLVLLTRVEPALPLGRLRARGQLSELRADDLRFTLPEATAFLNQAMACGLPDDDIALLQRRTEGWAAGLQMAALSLLSQTDRRAFVAAFAGDHRHIADYFAEEVLSRQPETIRSFLEQTAILDRLCGPLCDAVTNRHDGQAMLELIERANLFLVPLDDDRRWYRYHHLLSDLLRARLRKAQPGLVPTLHSRASRWYEQEGFSLEAAGHAMAAKDYERLVDISERNAQEWWADASSTFVDPANFAPAGVVAGRPSLCILRGWGSVIQGRLDEAARLFDLAEGLIADPLWADAPAMLAFISLVRKYMSELAGTPCTVTEADFQALARIPEHDIAMRNSAGNMLSYILMMNGDLEGAAPLLLAAAERDLSHGSTSSLAPANSRLARLRLVQGRLSDAEALLRKNIGTIEDLGSGRFYVNGSLHATLADVLRERNDLAEASRQADEGIRCNEAWGIPNAISQALQAKARVLAAMGDYDGALALVDRDERISLGRVTPADLVSERRALLVDILLAKGDLTLAERWVRDSGLTPGDQPSFRREREYLGLARVLLATERSSEAAALLNRLIADAIAGGRNGRLIEALVLLASAQAQSNTHAAVATLKRALANAEPEGYVRTFVAPGEPVAQLLRLVAVEGRAVGKYAQRILNPGALAAEPSQPPSQAAEPLSGRELEVLGLLAAGMPNRDIAAALTLTLGTVKTHVHSILGKLEAANRTQAIARARERGLIGD